MMTDPGKSGASSFLKDFWRVLLGVLISIVLLVAVFLAVDFAALKNELLSGDYRFLAFAVLSFLVSLAARSFAWRVLLEKQASLRQVFLTINEGYFLNNILPFRLGEVGRAFLLSRTTSLKFWQIVPTIVLERAFDMLLVVTILLASLPFVAGVEGAAAKAGVVAALVFLALVFLHLLARNRARALEWYRRLQARAALLRRLPLEQVDSFFRGLSALTDLRRFLLAFSGMALAWLLLVFYYFLALRIFIPDAPLVWAAFGISMVGLGVAVPSAPGQVGVVEAALVFVLGLIGVANATALAYALVVHAIYLLLTSLLGMVGLAADGESLVKVYREIRAQLSKPKTV